MECFIKDTKKFRDTTFGFEIFSPEKFKHGFSVTRRAPDSNQFAGSIAGVPAKPRQLGLSPSQALEKRVADTPFATPAPQLHSARGEASVPVLQVSRGIRPGWRLSFSQSARAASGRMRDKLSFELNYEWCSQCPYKSDSCYSSSFSSCLFSQIVAQKIEC